MTRVRSDEANQAFTLSLLNTAHFSEIPCLDNQTNPQRAFARKYRVFPQANLNIVDLTINRAGLHDQRH